MEEITITLKGGPSDGQQMEVERGRPHIEVASVEKHDSGDFLMDFDCPIAPRRHYERSLYVKSNHSDLEYIFSEPK